jgi:GT2 family glycosyltransferase
MVTKFLEGDSPWLWMVDADEVFDKGHAMKLWEVADEYEADMVSGLAMIWKEQNTPIPSVFFDDPDNEGRLIQYYNVLPDGPKRIAACGLASVLVHRRVFEAMSHPRHPEYRWFDFLPNEDIDIVGDEMTGIDVQFFVRARRLGFTLMLNPEARATSVEEIGVGYREWKTFWGQYSEEE